MFFSVKKIERSSEMKITCFPKIQIKFFHSNIWVQPSLMQRILLQWIPHIFQRAFNLILCLVYPTIVFTCFGSDSILIKEKDIGVDEIKFNSFFCPLFWPYSAATTGLGPSGFFIEETERVHVFLFFHRKIIVSEIF